LPAGTHRPEPAPCPILVADHQGGSLIIRMPTTGPCQSAGRVNASSRERHAWRTRLERRVADSWRRAPRTFAATPAGARHFELWLPTLVRRNQSTLLAMAFSQCHGIGPLALRELEGTEAGLLPRVSRPPSMRSMPHAQADRSVSPNTSPSEGDRDAAMAAVECPSLAYYGGHSDQFVVALLVAWLSRPIRKPSLRRFAICRWDDSEEAILLSECRVQPRMTRRARSRESNKPMADRLQ